MATLHGITNTDIYPQPGFDVHLDDNGGVTGSGTYAISKDALAVPSVIDKFQNGVSLQELDDDPSKAVYAFLLISSAIMTYEEGDLQFIDVKFTGSASAQYDPTATGTLPRYTLDLSSSDLPLSDHPKWTALDDTVQTVLGYLLSGIYLYDIGEGDVVIPQEDGSLVINGTLSDLLTEDAIEFAILIAKGRTTYPSPSISWTETKTGNSPLSGSQLNKLTKISTPRGNPPTVSNRNWILGGGTQDQVGATYQTRLTWNLSGLEEFSEFLHG